MKNVTTIFTTMLSDVMGQTKWTISWSSFEEYYALCLVELEKNELWPNNQSINSDKYYSQLDELKIAIQEKRPELINRKVIVFHQDNARTYVYLTTPPEIVGSWLQCAASVTLHLQNFNYSSHYKILLVARTSYITE